MFPHWIRSKALTSGGYERTKSLLEKLGLNSVCTSAECPNKFSCWSELHATFMVLGKTCTRSCLFCNVKRGEPETPDLREPDRIALAVKELDLGYVVITSVTRDDLDDKGAGHFASVVKAIKTETPGTIVELLIPDMGGNSVFLRKIASSGAEVIGHNIETPEKLYPVLRRGADYARSLSVLRKLARNSAAAIVKSSIITGLGESMDEIFSTLEDLKKNGVSIVYIGQYLSPSREHWPVKKFYTPEEFDLIEKRARDMGFAAVLAGPMVRSSFKARESYLACKKKMTRKGAVLTSC